MKKSDFDYIWTDKKRTIFGLPISFTRYFLTKEKFITRKGFFTIVEDEFELYRVTDKKLKLPFFQRLFKCGTILLTVKDVDTPIKDLTSVKDPRKVLSLLDTHINIQRDKYNIRGRDMVGTNNIYQCDEHE
ncbi:MAG: PH domain-containing protein [Ruminococcus sp.]|nr:PH domain-containing protein [Ruminococcus sp.]